MAIQDPNIKLKEFLEKEKSYLEDLKKIDLDKNWKKFQKTLKSKSSRDMISPFSDKFRLLFRIAAAVILLLAVSAILYFTSYLPTHHIVQVHAEPGHMDIRLSDGTDIALNEGAMNTSTEEMFSIAVAIFSAIFSASPSRVICIFQLPPITNCLIPNHLKKLKLGK